MNSPTSAKSRKVKTPILTFKPAPAALPSFIDTIAATSALYSRFERTNLDEAIKSAIEDGLLYIAPEGKTFSSVHCCSHRMWYRAPIGGDEAFVIADYSITLTYMDECDDEEALAHVIHTVYIPAHFFTSYREMSCGYVHNPEATKLVFDYPVKEFAAWVNDYAKRILTTEVNSLTERSAAIAARLAAMTKALKKVSKSAF